MTGTIDKFISEDKLDCETKEVSIELKRHLDEIANHITRAKIHFNIYSVYKVERAEFYQGMNKYSDFFMAAMEAHFCTMIMSLSKLYETNRRTYNVGKLFKLLTKQNIEFDKNEYDEGLKLRLLKYYNLRNNVYGHSSIKFDVSKAFAKADIKNVEEIAKLIEDIEIWYSKIYLNVLNIYHTFSARKVKEDVQSILEILNIPQKNDQIKSAIH